MNKNFRNALGALLLGIIIFASSIPVYAATGFGEDFPINQLSIVFEDEDTLVVEQFNDYGQLIGIGIIFKDNIRILEEAVNSATRNGLAPLMMTGNWFGRFARGTAFGETRISADLNFSFLNVPDGPSSFTSVWFNNDNFFAMDGLSLGNAGRSGSSAFFTVVNSFGNQVGGATFTVWPTGLITFSTSGGFFRL